MDNRLAQLRALMQQQKLEAIFISTPANVRYLSGFTGEDSYLLISPSQQLFITDSRYLEQAENECPGFTVQLHRAKERSLNSIIADFCAGGQLTRLAFESNNLSYAQYQALRTALDSQVQLIAQAGLVEQLRQIKSPAEIDLLRQACSATDRAFALICDYIKPGLSEQDIARELLYIIMQLGYDNSFPIIAASGANGSLPHAIPSQRQVAVGDFITLDFGCMHQGYHADMTRTVCLGEPSEQQRQIYDIVLAAKTLAQQQIKPGMACAKVDAIARDYIANHGYGENFGHGLGHGVGLDIHEQPSLNPSSQATLQAGCFVTVEPGIYLPGCFGVRIEDTVLVTEAGAESMFSSPLELVCL